MALFYAPKYQTLRCTKNYLCLQSYATQWKQDETIGSKFVQRGKSTRKFAKTRSKKRTKEGAWATAKFKVGHFVRISRTKNTFERGYEKNFSEEMFKIQRVSRRQNLYTYILEELNGEIIDEFFYTEELVLVGRERIADDQKFKVEQVIRTRGRGTNKQVLVKWVGYSDKFNFWIKTSELERI